MKRRSAIIGMAGLAVGGGAIVSTGAFSQVEAQRSVTVATAGDADANLGIEPFAGSQNSSYVDDSGDTVEIILDDINQNSITNIDKLLQVTNNGTEEIEVGFDNQYEKNHNEGTISELPGGWGYTVKDAANDNDSAAVVMWMSPSPGNMSKSLKKVRPELSTTGFVADGDSGSTLVDGRSVHGEVGKIDHEPTGRTVGAGTKLHVGTIVDTRDDTINTLTDYTSSAYVESPYSEVTFFAERTN